MGEWKAQVSLRVRQELRRELEEYAARDKRKLGNLDEVLMEWTFEQLKDQGVWRVRWQSSTMIPAHSGRITDNSSVTG